MKGLGVKNDIRLATQSKPAELTCPCGQIHTITIATAQGHHNCFSSALSAALDQLVIVEEELAVLRQAVEGMVP